MPFNPTPQDENSASFRRYVKGGDAFKDSPNANALLRQPTLQNYKIHRRVQLRNPTFSVILSLFCEEFNYLRPDDSLPFCMQLAPSAPSGSTTEPDLQQTKKPLRKSKRFLGGDGGNRTRVRKIRLSNLYEHSQLFRFVRLQVN